MRWRIAAATAAALTCLGFAEPTISPQFVSLDFQRTYITDGKKPKAIGTGFSVYYERTCTQSKYAGFGRFTSGSQSVAVPGDVRLFIAATGARDGKECHGYMGFETQRGHSYAVSLEAAKDGCVIDVIDKASGERPAGLRFLKAQSWCGPYLNRLDKAPDETPWH